MTKTFSERSQGTQYLCNMTTNLEAKKNHPCFKTKLLTQSQYFTSVYHEYRLRHQWWYYLLLYKLLLYISAFSVKSSKNLINSLFCQPPLSITELVLHIFICKVFRANYSAVFLQHWSCIIYRHKALFFFFFLNFCGVLPGEFSQMGFRKWIFNHISSRIINSSHRYKPSLF